MFKRVLLAFAFVAAFGAAGLGISSIAAAHGCGGYRTYGYSSGYGYSPAYYHGYGYGPSVSYYSGGHRSYHGGHYRGHGGTHFSIGF